MKKKLLIMCLIASVGVLSFALDSSIYYQYGIVPQFTQHLRIGSGDLLSIEASADELLLSLDLSAYYRLSLQNEQWEVSLSDSLDTGFSNFPYSYYNDPFFFNSGSTSITRYFMNILPIPIQAFGSGTVQSSVILEDEDFMFPFGTFYRVGWLAGIGIGRMVNVRPVAQIIAAASKLDMEFSEEQIIAAARIVAKSGEYDYRYRERSDEEYYGDIAAALGISDKAMEVRRVLRDTWAISYRSIGASFRVYYAQDYDGDELSDPLLGFIGDIGIPIGLNMHFAPALNGSIVRDPYFENLVSYVSVHGQYSIDHTTNWATSLFGSLSVNNDLNFGYDLGLVTGVQIYDRLYTDFAIICDGGIGSGGTVSLDIYLQYYIL